MWNDQLPLENKDCSVYGYCDDVWVSVSERVSVRIRRQDIIRAITAHWRLPRSCPNSCFSRCRLTDREEIRNVPRFFFPLLLFFSFFGQKFPMNKSPISAQSNHLHIDLLFITTICSGPFLAAAAATLFHTIKGGRQCLTTSTYSGQVQLWLLIHRNKLRQRQQI